MVSAKDVMEHFAFPGNIDFAADDQGAFHVLFMKGCCVYSLSVKQCLPSVNHEQFPIQMTQNCKHSKCLQILAEEDFPLKLLWRTPIKIHRQADRRRQPRSREHRCSTAKAKSSTQRPQTWTEAATKYYNYIVNETDEERKHRLPTLPKATRLDQATLTFIVKIIFFDTAIGSKNYALQEYLSKDSGQPISLYTKSNNGFHSKLILQ